MSDPLEDFLATYQPPAAKAPAASPSAAPPAKRDPIFDEIDALDDALALQERTRALPSSAMPAGYATTTATTPRELRAENKQAGRESMQAGLFEDAAKSVAYGVARGGTLGLVDRAVGLGTDIGERMGATEQTPADPNAYRQGRREYLEGERPAAANHPGLYLGGEVGGGMIPGVAASPLRFAGRFGNPALLGAAAGVGNTTSDEPLRMMLGAGAGAAGGALGEATVGTLLRRMIRGAPERQTNAVLRDAVESDAGRANPTEVKRLVRDIHDVRNVVETDADLAAAMRLPGAEAAPIIEQRAAAARAGQPQRYAEVDRALAKEPLTVTQLLQKVVDAEKRLPRNFLTPGKMALLKVRDALRDDLVPHWTGQNSWKGEHVELSAEQLREWVTTIQATAEQAMGSINGTNAYKVPQAVAKVCNDILEERLDKAASKGAQAAVEGIRESDRRFSAIQRLAEVVDTRAFKELGQSIGLSRRISDQNTRLAVPALLASGHFLPAAAVAARGPAMRALDRGARFVNDRALAPLQNAAVAGNPNAQLVRQGIESFAPQSMLRAGADSLLSSPPAMPTLRQQLTGTPVAAPQLSDYQTGTAIQ